VESFWTTFSETWSGSDMVFSAALVGTIFVMLYTIALINKKLRLIEHELQSIKKDQSVMSDELEIVASSHEGKSA
jgi:hypothetical protein